MEEYGMTLVLIILAGGIIGLLMYILHEILSGHVFEVWGG